MRTACLLLALAGCNHNDAGSDGGAPDLAIAGGGADLAGVAPVPSGTTMLAACASLGLGAEQCSYTWQFDPTQCANQGCKRMVIYFSGGQESCPPVTSTVSYLAYYKNRGYVAVCAMDFETATGSGTYPRHKEAPRLDTLVKAITSDPNLRGAWSGEFLLFSG